MRFDELSFGSNRAVDEGLAFKQFVENCDESRVVVIPLEAELVAHD